jgi:hypothetical protein
MLHVGHSKIQTIKILNSGNLKKNKFENLSKKLWENSKNPRIKYIKKLIHEKKRTMPNINIY